MLGTRFERTSYHLSRSWKSSCWVVKFAGTLNQVLYGISDTRMLPKAEVTGAHMRVSWAFAGPKVSNVENLLLERKNMSIPNTETYVKLYEFAVEV